MEIVNRNFQSQLHLSDHPVLNRIYAARGILKVEDLNLSLSTLLSPDEMPDVEVAANRLVSALFQKEKILVIGDYDADGATSVALCLLCLRAFGFENVDFLVPNRFQFGYGLSPDIVELAQTFEPALLLTVDNGTSSVDGVARANEIGVDVVITDHHLPGSSKPNAFALVNPVIETSKFQSKSMAGVGVAYYLMGVIRRLLRERDWFDADRPEPNLADYLDLVALGTVADVVPLDKNNRTLVYHGIQRIKKGRCRPGIKALVEIAGRELSTICAQDLGFSIGPRLNAAGRLDDISVGIRCLLEEDSGRAQAFASSLNQLNKERREIESNMLVQASSLLSEHEGSFSGYGIAIYSERFHQGVVGILASRIKEKFNRPVIAFADDSDSRNGEIKGSARSIEGLHIRDLLDRIAAKNPGLLLRFGGHAMAAGLSIKKVHFERFKVIFDKFVASSVSDDQLNRRIVSDGQLENQFLTKELVLAIEEAGPWGNEFSEPIFDGQFRLVSQRVVGEEHLKMTLAQGDLLLDAIAFRQPFLEQNPEQVHVVYKLQINRYAGSETIQLIVEYLEGIP